MTQLLNMFGFLAVLLRAATLAFQSLVIGGVVFSALALRKDDELGAMAACRRLIRWCALALAVTQFAFVGADSAILQASAGISFSDVASAGFFRAGLAAALAALVCFAAASFPGYRWFRSTTLIASAMLLASSVITSHAAARLDNRAFLVCLTALHQAAAAVWIGGLPYLLIAVGKAGDTDAAQRISARFSRLAQWSVGAILLGGIGLAFKYIDSIPALYGTSYGVMVLGKTVMVVELMTLGGFNFFLVRGLRKQPQPLLTRLRRFSEAEIGIGFTAILAAASLTSQPPAADIGKDIVRLPQIVERMSPRPPRFNSPPLNELSPPTLPSDENTLQSYVPGAVSHPSTAGDIAWSEYNHNWSGLVVLTMGILAVMSRVFGMKWARAWPLAFLGLALFLFFRADPEVWPLGQKGFWYSLTDPEVLQHRIFALMIVAFAAFEWGIQVGRIRSKMAALVFPGVCIAGGALLMTHSHALGNAKDEYLAELSHLPIALFAVAAGWSRWLEQRLDTAWRRVPAMIWPVCFVAIGLILLFYREH